MSGGGNFSGVNEAPCLLSDCGCDFPIYFCLDEFDGDGVAGSLYRGRAIPGLGFERHRLTTDFKFGDPASDAFLFDFDVVVRQGINIFDGGFDDRSVKFTGCWVVSFAKTEQLFECFNGDEGCFALVSIGIDVVETDFP